MDSSRAPADERDPWRARRAKLRQLGEDRDQADKAKERICRRAGLPVFLFHRLRHTFGAHAALFGVNPWRLQAWLGHKRIDDDALRARGGAHPRELTEHVQQGACSETDPDRRILAMLAAREKAVAKPTAVMAEESAA